MSKSQDKPAKRSGGFRSHRFIGHPDDMGDVTYPDTIPEALRKPPREHTAEDIAAQEEFEAAIAAELAKGRTEKRRKC